MDFLGEIKKEGKFVKTVSVEVDDGEREVDVFLMKPKADKPGEKFKDPFLKVGDGLPQYLRRKLSRLEKKAGDAGTKALDPQVVSGYDVLQLVAPPYNLDELAKLYETNTAHNAAVTMKAINIVGLGYQWIENARTQLALEQAQAKGEKTLEVLVNKLKNEKISLDETLTNLNVDEEFGEVMIKVWTDVEALGNGYLEIGRNRNGTIGYLGHIPGQTIRIRAARDGFVQLVSNKYVYFRNFSDSETSNPLKNDPQPNEIMHFKKYSPNSSYYGVPDIIPALLAVAGDKFAREYNLDYFENKAVPRYAFIVKGAKLSQKAQETLVNYFRNELKGKHHGTLYIPLPASIGQEVDAKFEQLEVGIQEGSFIEYLRENRQEILMAHRVPPGKVSVFDNMNLAVARDADKTFKEQVCAPEQRAAEKKVNRIMGEFTTTHELKFIQADIVDADIKSRVHDRYLRTQVLTPNDVLRELGKPVRPDGNIPLPYQKGPNEGGPGQRTSDGAKPRTVSPADQTGQRQVKGQAADAGQN